MAVLATDDFNRADNNDPGADWTPIADASLNALGFNIVSNTLQPGAPLNNDVAEEYVGAVFPSDQYAQAKISVTGGASNSGPGVIVRSQGISSRSLYRCTVCKAATDNVVVRLSQAGSTTIGSRTTTWVDGDTLRLEIQGTTIRVYQNGVQLGADMTDATLSGGSPGVYYSSTVTDPIIDDWEAGDFSVTPPTLFSTNAIAARF